MDPATANLNGSEPDPVQAGAMKASSHRRTLGLIGLLHGFTHVYNVALVPLYLPLQQEFKLASLGQATFLVTAMMIAYLGPSYGLGVLADRMNRKWLLAVGLGINGLGFVGLSCAPSYGWALASVLVAGLGGSFFHPAATSMISHLFPDRKGRALGLVGIGASVGFFVGSIYSGWRAQHAGWRAPVLELGLAGLATAAVFAWLAEDDPASPADRAEASRSGRLFATPQMAALFLGLCLVLSLRDFAGASVSSLGSLFLQRAHAFDLAQTGLALSGIYLASAISNPLFGRLSDHARHRCIAGLILVAGLIVAVFPRLPRSGLIPAFLAYGFFFMASYPVVEAALMDAVPPGVRGRLIGLFITVGGLLGNTAHWWAGRWVERLGPASYLPQGFYGTYVGLALLLLGSLASLPLLLVIRQRTTGKGRVRTPSAAPGLLPAGSGLGPENSPAERGPSTWP